MDLGLPFVGALLGVLGDAQGAKRLRIHDRLELIPHRIQDVDDTCRIGTRDHVFFRTGTFYMDGCRTGSEEMPLHRVSEIRAFQKLVGCWRRDNRRLRPVRLCLRAATRNHDHPRGQQGQGGAARTSQTGNQAAPV